MKKNLTIAFAVVLLFGAAYFLITGRKPSANLSSTPAFTPDPNVVAFINAGNPFGPSAPAPWLEAKSSDANVPPGAAPATTFLVSRVEPVVVKDGAAWKITFKTP